MKFRRAGPPDWEHIGALLSSNRLPLEGALDHIGNFLVAHDEGGLAACGGLEVYGLTALVRSVAVAEAHRGQGLGQALVARLSALAVDQRVRTLVLLTETAEPYFRKLGFDSVPRSALPEAVKVSAEFRGACPDSATAMLKRLVSVP